IARVAKELHTLYKQKHETKVAALKKSYEARWEKVVKDLESQIAVLKSEKAELKEKASAAPPPAVAAAADSSRPAAPDQDTRRLRLELSSVKAQLEAERKDKSDMVTLIEELLALQSTLTAPPPPPTPGATARQHAAEVAAQERRREESERRMENVRQSLGK